MRRSERVGSVHLNAKKTLLAVVHGAHLDGRLARAAEVLALLRMDRDRPRLVPHRLVEHAIELRLAVRRA